MPWLDRQGRLFGRVSVVDLYAVCLVLALVPVVQFGYRVTKLTEPVIRSLQPSEVVKGSGQLVEVLGKNFSEGCTVEFGEWQLEPIEVTGSSRLVIEIPPEVPTGKYVVSVVSPKQIMGLATAQLTVRSVAPPEPPYTGLAAFVCAFDVHAAGMRALEAALSQEPDLHDIELIVLDMLSRDSDPKGWFRRRKRVLVKLILKTLIVPVKERGQDPEFLYGDIRLKKGVRFQVVIEGVPLIAELVTEPVPMSHSRLKQWIVE